MTEMVPERFAENYRTIPTIDKTLEAAVLFPGRENPRLYCWLRACRSATGFQPRLRAGGHWYDLEPGAGQSVRARAGVTASVFMWSSVTRFAPCDADGHIQRPRGQVFMWSSVTRFAPSLLRGTPYYLLSTGIAA